MKHLSVVIPFGSYAIGDIISDADEVAAIRASHPRFVVAIKPRKATKIVSSTETAAEEAKNPDKDTTK